MPIRMNNLLFGQRGFSGGLAGEFDEQRDVDLFVVEREAVVDAVVLE